MRPPATGMPLRASVDPIDCFSAATSCGLVPYFSAMFLSKSGESNADAACFGSDFAISSTAACC
jgi:hypothetical protein